ncbi:MAG: hypothetical protein IID36_11135 [Planctomycetes bacterium]|nr:hypothetical protein [Planctomycetota bacterium]
MSGHDDLRVLLLTNKVSQDLEYVLKTLRMDAVFGLFDEEDPRGLR